MSSLKQIGEGVDDMLIWDDWYFVESEEADPEGKKVEAIDEDEDEDEMNEKKEEKGEAKEENEEEEEEEEEEGLLENLSIISKYKETKMGSSSMDRKHHHELRRFQFSPFFNKNKSKDIRILVKDYVLPFLPAKSLVRFRAVSMEWNQWIQSPFLAHQQSYSFQELSGYFYQQNQENIEFLTMNCCAYGVPKPSLGFLPESVTIKSSSNGLILCEDQNGNNTYYICNPVNKEWKELPQPHYYHRPETAIVLAFEPSVLNMDASYQLICPVTFVDQPMICFEVYSSKTRSWTESTTICLELEAGSTLRGSGFYVKGTAYWETSSRKVVAFNPTNAIHEIISLPNHCPQGGILTEMNEELCYIGISSIDGNDHFVEIYKGLYLDLKYKMKLHLQMALNRYRVLPCLNGNIVMILNGCAIHSCSLKNEKLEVIGWNAGRSEGMYLPYVNSLVSVG
ncbi:F-box protein At5g07610-like [Primulina huaijiensis]|uniref:F-box protein At5g07610-like n=1 Tax=Primulina huaijiensis TaxID=1492673 RepID=UPI003CC79860